MEDNKDHRWNQPTLSSPLSYAILSEDTDFIKTNSFTPLATNFLKILSFFKQDLKMLSIFDLMAKLKMLALFLSLKDNKEYIYMLNQHWIGKHPIQCCSNRLIYINTVLRTISLMLFFQMKDFSFKLHFSLHFRLN